MNEIQKVKVLAVRHLTDQTFVLRLERDGFEFEPGQCVNLGIPGEGVNREYSTYSSVNEPDFLEFLIRKVPGGLVSEKLQLLKAGDEVTLDGAYGLFVLKNPDDLSLRYRFIATGTGIAPFHSFVKSYPDLNYQILHGIRLVSEEYDRKDYGEGHYIACVSQEQVETGSGNFHGRVTDYLKKDPVEPKNIFYLCGNNSMINEVYDILRDQKVSGSNIFTEVFF